MTTATPLPLRDRLGLPDTAGRARLIGAHLVDSLGTGLILAFVLVYFTHTTNLPLATVGAAVSTARLLALPTALAVGPLIDRHGARVVAVGANALSALAYCGFLLTHQAWQIVLVCLLAQIGHVGYWTASTGLVVLASPKGERTRWFALVQTLRNTGMGLGGALGAVLMTGGGTGVLRLLVVLNAASYLLASILLATWRPTAAPAGEARTAEPGGYREVLRDRRYLLLVAVNLSFVFASMILSMLLAVYLTVGLHRNASVAGSLLVLNGVQVVLTQSVVARRLEGRRPTRVVAAGALLNAFAFGLFALLAAAPGWAVLPGLYTAMLVYNLAETVATPCREDLSVSLADPAQRGRYLAVYQLSWNVGQAVAPGLLTLLLDRGAAWPWLFLLVLSLAAVPGLLRLGRRPATSSARHV
ncbi:MFS transporter [Streptomyces kaniharaensis]|uniref:MFS transporter n=1 Tax=Streptomyces kaniharaensis TaxID=212423 RepID=A0A6N7KWY1_9ACTN|nr:MFS transporter [Streptomyces kaniharaensis]MQS16176.1 MFS transporter [Streptomyces kaniharaensis]